MRYVSKCIPKQMRLQPLPENIGTEQRVSEVVRQHVPGHRTGDGERPTAERAATMSWYEEMVAAGRCNVCIIVNAVFHMSNVFTCRV